jgi:hypothetical protein
VGPSAAGSRRPDGTSAHLGQRHDRLERTGAITGDFGLGDPPGEGMNWAVMGPKVAINSPQDSASAPANNAAARACVSGSVSVETPARSSAGATASLVRRSSVASVRMAAA